MNQDHGLKIQSLCDEKDDMNVLQKLLRQLYQQMEYHEIIKKHAIDISSEDPSKEDIKRDLIRVYDLLDKDQKMIDDLSRIYKEKNYPAFEIKRTEDTSSQEYWKGKYEGVLKSMNSIIYWGTQRDWIENEHTRFMNELFSSEILKASIDSPVEDVLGGMKKAFSMKFPDPTPEELKVITEHFQSQSEKKAA